MLLGVIDGHEGPVLFPRKDSVNAESEGGSGDESRYVPIGLRYISVESF